MGKGQWSLEAGLDPASTYLAFGFWTLRFCVEEVSPVEGGRHPDVTWTVSTE